MKFLKRFNESVDNVKEVVEDLLLDFSDDDLGVFVQIQKDAIYEAAPRIVYIGIGNVDENGYPYENSKNISIETTIDNLNSVNEYLVSENFKLKRIELWSQKKVYGLYFYEIYDLHKFISILEEFKSKDIPIKLIDVYYIENE